MRLICTEIKRIIHHLNFFSQVQLHVVGQPNQRYVLSQCLSSFSSSVFLLKNT